MPTRAVQLASLPLWPPLFNQNHVALLHIKRKADNKANGLNSRRGFMIIGNHFFKNVDKPMNGRAQLATLLQEADETYTTRVRKVSVYGLADNQLPEDAVATVVWQLVIDAREYGIKEIVALIQSVDIQFDLHNIDTEETVQQRVTWTGGAGWKIDVDCSAKSFPMTLIPVSVELMVRDRAITINF